MSSSNNFLKYDEVLTSILVQEDSILGFLSTIFNFLARRTDFYYVPEGPYENMGFPPGVAEELVLKVLRTCDPKNWKAPNGAKKPRDTGDINNEIMCSTVAQEVEVISDDYENNEEDTLDADMASNVAVVENASSQSVIDTESESTLSCSTTNVSDAAKSVKNLSIEDDPPPMIPTQKNSDTYNGAKREKYSWSQTIMELDVTVYLPHDIKSSKDIKVTINPADVCVICNNHDIFIKDTLPYKIKPSDSFWSISEGKLLIHLEKVQERWWNRFLESEEAIDLSKIDCSRPLNELPEDHIAKVREIQWNQEQKLKGLPTSDQIRNMEILRKAWDADGSPFKGQKFDPSVLQP